MKSISTLLAISVGAVALLGSVSASAGTICSNCAFAGDGTYMGSHNANTNDFSGFRHEQAALNTDPLWVPNDGNTQFLDDWIFDLAPAGRASFNGSFQLFSANPAISGMSNFLIEIFDATATGCTLTTPASICATHALVGPAIRTSTTNAGGAFISLTGLSAGTYAMRVSGFANSNFTQYSGQLQTFPNPTPEPGTLGLLGAALLGLAGAARRRKSV